MRSERDSEVDPLSRSGGEGFFIYLFPSLPSFLSKEGTSTRVTVPPTFIEVCGFVKITVDLRPSDSQEDPKSQVRTHTLRRGPGGVGRIRGSRETGKSWVPARGRTEVESPHRGPSDHRKVDLYLRHRFLFAEDPVSRPFTKVVPQTRRAAGKLVWVPRHSPRRLLVSTRHTQTFSCTHRHCRRPRGPLRGAPVHRWWTRGHGRLETLRHRRFYV